MIKYITPEDIFNALDYLPDDCQNPVIDGDHCVYTDIDNNHCIVGDIMVKIGFEPPGWEDHNNINPIAQIIEDRYPEEFDHDAIEMLQIGQNTADKLTHYDDPLAWGNAKQDMISFYKRLKDEENK
jgi:hypothetical protein